MYAKYHTDALVLNGTPVGEADKRLALYTREFGLIRARASAIRRENSRMRYALQSFARAHVSLIRGETGWRVAGALSVDSFSGSRVAVTSFARIGLLVSRLVGGEEKNESLFLLLESAHHAFRVAEKERLPVMELICVARALSLLGYLSHDALGVAHVTESLFAPETMHVVAQHKETLLTSVNRALAETHL